MDSYKRQMSIDHIHVVNLQKSQKFRGPASILTPRYFREVHFKNQIKGLRDINIEAVRAVTVQLKRIN